MVQLRSGHDKRNEIVRDRHGNMRMRVDSIRDDGPLEGVRLSTRRTACIIIVGRDHLGLSNRCIVPSVVYVNGIGHAFVYSGRDAFVMQTLP